MQRNTKINRKRIIWLTMISVSVLLRVQNLRMPIGNDMHAFRQTQTAIVVQNYLKEGWSLLHYQIPVRGQPWEVIFECPIYQTIVYMIMKVFGRTNVDLWCRLISVATFYLSFFMLKKIVETMLDEELSFYICSVYLLAPFTILWSRAALIDYMSVLFALIYVWGFYEWSAKGGEVRYVVAMIFGILAYLLKATTMFPYVFLLAGILIGHFNKQCKTDDGRISLIDIRYFIKENMDRLLLLSCLCVIPVVFGIMWTGYADSVKSQSIHTVDLTSQALKGWNYGTIEMKLNWADWKVIFERSLNYMGGGYIALFLVINYIFLGGRRYVFVLINNCVAVLLTICILFNLYYVHDYYIIAISPILSIIMGIMLYVTIRALSNEGKTGVILTEVSCVVLLASTIHYNVPYLSYALDGKMRNENVGVYLKTITTSDERIMVQGEDWSPVTMYYAERKGFMLTKKEFEMEGLDDFLKEEYYTTLVAHSIDYVKGFAGHYSYLIQYPKQNSIYIFKFYEDGKIVEEGLKKETIHISMDQEEYYIENGDLDVITIEYDGSIADKEVDVVFYDADGNEYRDSIYLFGDRRIAYYRIGAWTDNVEKVVFDLAKENGT